MKTEKLARTFRVDSGKHFRLKDYDPADTGHGRSEDNAKEALLEGIARTAELQDQLYAQGNWSILLIFQAMDAAGKDGAISHVMSGVNPEGCDVHAFKPPSAEERAHASPRRPAGEVAAPGLWAGRYRSIVELERHLHRNGTRVVKFFLHLSREEQRRRF